MKQPKCPSTDERIKKMWCIVPAKLLQPCPTLFDSMDCSPPGSSVNRILQARILEWVAMLSSWGSSQPRDRNWVSCVSCIAGKFFTTEPLGTLQVHLCYCRWWYVILFNGWVIFHYIFHPFMANSPLYIKYMCAMSLQSCPTPCNPMDRSPPGSSVHGDSPIKNNGVSFHALLQGILPTQGSNPYFLVSYIGKCVLHH